MDRGLNNLSIYCSVFKHHTPVGSFSWCSLFNIIWVDDPRFLLKGVETTDHDISNNISNKITCNNT